MRSAPRLSLLLRGALALLVLGTFGIQAAPAPTGSPAPEKSVRRADPVSPAASPGPVNPASGAPPAVPVALPVRGAGDSSGTYVLSPDDVVDVKVFQEPDLETTTRVSKDGSISLPLVGSVAVAGKTPKTPPG